MPLPAGQVEVFQSAGDRPLLIGNTLADDEAIGEDVEYRLDAGPGVSVEVADRPARRRADGHLLTVTNANPQPIDFAAKLGTSDENQKMRFRQPLRRSGNQYIWTVTVPANGTATFDYQVISAEVISAD